MTYVEMIYKLIKEEYEGLDAIYEDSILELVGKTPLVRINKLNKTDAEILAKLEFFLHFK